MTLEKFFIFDQKLSLLESIHVLYNSKEYVLAAIVGGFSVVFPIIKLLLLTLIWFLLRDEDKITKWILRIEVVGNWSMLDVFVVAITVVVIKLSGLGKIEVHYGLYLFAASVILTKLSLLIIHGLFIPKKNLKIKNLKTKNNKQKKGVRINKILTRNLYNLFYIIRSNLGLHHARHTTHATHAAHTAHATHASSTCTSV